MVRSSLVSSLLAMLAFVASGCGERSPAPQQSPTSPNQANTTAPSAPAWILTQAPEGALPVAQIKPDAKEGDRVVIRGRIGGRAQPISDGAPVMIIMDPAIPSCADNPEDRCRTPWDYCCEPAEVKTANNATIQVVDAGGQVVADSLQAAGLQPLDEVIVVGTVGPRPDPSVLTILATGVHKVHEPRP